jgi:hypothetical protein
LMKEADLLAGHIRRKMKEANPEVSFRRSPE